MNIGDDSDHSLNYFTSENKKNLKNRLHDLCANSALNIVKL